MNPVEENINESSFTVSVSLKKLSEMAKNITDTQELACNVEPENVDWEMLEEMWFDWLFDEIIKDDE